MVTATYGARRNVDDVRIRLQHANGSLRMEFDTFDIAATDNVKGISGSIPDGLVVTSADEFDTALSLFDDGFPRLRLSTSPRQDVL